MSPESESPKIEVHALTELERLQLENLALKRQILEQQILTLKLEQQQIESALRQRLQLQGAMSVDVMGGYVRILSPGHE